MPKGDDMKPVTMEAAPSPMKNTTIIPTMLQRSPSQPAGNAPTPNNTLPTVSRASNSP